MMGYPYTAGQVLTAADLNAYAGLILVKTQTIGTAVSSVTVTDAFSSTFDNYRVTISGSDCSSSGANMRLRLGSTSTAYYAMGTEVTLSASNRIAINNGSSFLVGKSDTNGQMAIVCDLFGPNQTVYTAMLSSCSGSLRLATLAGQLQDTTAETSFLFFPATGTMTGGTIRVYGYNNG